MSTSAKNPPECAADEIGELRKYIGAAGALGAFMVGGVCGADAYKLQLLQLRLLLCVFRDGARREHQAERGERGRSERSCRALQGLGREKNRYVVQVVVLVLLLLLLLRRLHWEVALSNRFGLCLDGSWFIQQKKQSTRSFKVRTNSQSLLVRGFAWSAKKLSHCLCDSQMLLLPDPRGSLSSMTSTSVCALGCLHRSNPASRKVRHRAFSRVVSASPAADDEYFNCPASARLAEPSVLEEINTERQKLRAKRRLIEQHSIQVESEATELAAKRLQLEEGLKKTQDELQELRLTIRSEEKEAELARRRLLQEAANLKTDNARSNVQLKAKRKKLRSQLKNELASLRRRIAFVSSELERAQMTNEDVYSVVGELISQQEALDGVYVAMHLQLDRCKECTDTWMKETVAELADKVSNFHQRSQRSSTTEMQQELDAKSKELQELTGVLREKEVQRSSLLPYHRYVLLTLSLSLSVSPDPREEARDRAQQGASRPSFLPFVAHSLPLKSKLSDLDAEADRSASADDSEYIAQVRAEISEFENRARSLQDLLKVSTMKAEDLEARAKDSLVVRLSEWDGLAHYECFLASLCFTEQLQERRQAAAIKKESRAKEKQRVQADARARER
ncbi:hypothetical protein PybrP1_009301, partial [[Pythium] brassicae (nom. inval.)]